MRSEVSAAGKTLELDLKRFRIVLVGLIALKIAVLFVIAWNRRFVMDEFVQFGSAKNINQIATLAATQIKAQGYVPFFELAHLIGWNARSMLLIGRMEMALLACGTLAIVYASARSLGESKVRAALIVLILLSFSNFIERIFETRGDPLSVFFAAAALLVVLRGRADKAATVLVAGILSGLAFLATQKSVYFNVALGIALVADAALARRYAAGIARGALLVLGWLVPIIAYCFVFGGTDPIPVARSLVFGPGDVATHGADVYGGLRHFVVQTLRLNAVLYAFCFAGIALTLLRIRSLDERTRIAIIFTVVITALVFAHNQPWPYVFIMALPFMALWSLVPLDRIPADKAYLRVACVAALGIAVAASFIRNVQYLQFGNRDQLELVSRAESLIGPRERYFDGVGMLPNRPEPSTLWLDRKYVVSTLDQGNSSEAYRIFANSPPKIILWSYRMDAIEPVVGPLIRNSYVQVAPNIRLAGRRLQLGQAVEFDVPIAGTYALYSENGTPLQGELQVGRAVVRSPIRLARGRTAVTLRSGAGQALLLPSGSYAGRFIAAADHKDLFEGVYD